MLLSLLLDTLCGHKLLDSYARGRKNSFVVKAHCYKLPVCLDPLFCVPLRSRGDHAFPFPSLFCQLSGTGNVVSPVCSTTGLSWSLSVVFLPDTVEQNPTVQPDGEPAKESVCERKGSVTCRNTHSLGSKHCMCGDSCDTAGNSSGVRQHAGQWYCGEQMQVLEDREQREDRGSFTVEGEGAA